jgi:hypothetical protein
MSPIEKNLLIDHLDQTLSGAELQAIEDLIKKDEEASREWSVLQFTVANIKDAGLYEQISLAKDQFSNEQKIYQKPRTTGIVISMSQKIMRVAAAFLLLCMSVAVVKYMSVTNTSIYNDYYSTYNLNTTRAAGNDDVLDNAYRTKQWDEVINITRDIKDKSSKHFFLSGIAHMELKQYPDAIGAFKSVVEKNRSTGDDYFNDDAHFYLAMSYLANKEGDKALLILEAIKKEPGHLYNGVVKKMGIDFTVLALKERK